MPLSLFRSRFELDWVDFSAFFSFVSHLFPISSIDAYYIDDKKLIKEK